MTSDFGAPGRQNQDRPTGPLTDEPPPLLDRPEVVSPTPAVSGFGDSGSLGSAGLTTSTTSAGTSFGSGGSATEGGAKQKAAEVAGTAKDQAAEVADTAKDAGKQVAQTAKEQVGEVTAEASRQAKQVLSQVRSEVTDQAATQQQRVAGGLRSLADELQGLASGDVQNGPATDLTRQAADRMQSVAQWLENRDPGSVLDEVRSFARRRPALYLAIAAAAGVVAGRLARGLTADEDSGSSSTGVSGRTDTSRFTTSYSDSGAGYSAGISGPDPLYADPVVPTVPPTTLPPAGTGLGGPRGDLTR